jgi:hypothetical protein
MNTLNHIHLPSGISVIIPVYNSSAILLDLVRQLVVLHQQMNQLKVNSKEGNTFVNNLEKEIVNLRNAIKENLKSLVKSTNIIITEMNFREKSLDNQIERLPKMEKNYLRIERKFIINEQLYNFLLQKRAEAGISKAALLSSHQRIDFAQSKGIILPNEKVNILIALILGFVIPIIIFLALDSFNDKVQDAREVAKLTKIPVIGTIGHNDKNTDLVVFKHPKGMLSESLRSVRTNLDYFSGDKRIILLTSSISGEGKTFCAINLASVLALSGKKLYW